ncbi:MAG: hypothetical protein COV60_02330 [Candidatus Magasanikbacteria bacterium CG11_big_fil_rev_8_21_14_0_20_43_7]|uniref:Uncharacterized protein n=1 Tax=Candidatus Magasanikbacteria bacterium CG11_big_fil_rev_8_21_14_0_20_43_7 TaxID=1974654 RepID=A0A2H0N2F4_9BACT|nr:MAG: hypothetical protein COV60_02330 [Candidatus Magasanikbacteria bacterium CG11_big_fil_rev_8_21_14_0_20_43_7]
MTPHEIIKGGFFGIFFAVDNTFSFFILKNFFAPLREKEGRRSTFVRPGILCYNELLTNKILYIVF